MRRGLALVLLFFGAFLLVTAGVLRFWGAGALEKTPLNVTSVTHLEGTIDKLNPATGEVENLPVKVTSVTKSDDNKSTDEVVAFVNSTCVVIDRNDPPDCVDADDPDSRLVTASTDVFATDRVTAEAVNSSKYLPADAEPHRGLINKWPFDAKKKDYLYWDDVLNEAVLAEYSGTEEYGGIKTYEYVVKVDQQPAEVVEGIDGLYTAEKTIDIDPRTGSIIYQKNEDRRTLENGDVLSDLSVEFTDAEVKESAAESDDGARQLWLIGVLVPILGLVLGLLFLVVGALMLVWSRREERGSV